MTPRTFVLATLLLLGLGPQLLFPGCFPSAPKSYECLRCDGDKDCPEKLICTQGRCAPAGVAQACAHLRTETNQEQPDATKEPPPKDHEPLTETPTIEPDASPEPLQDASLEPPQDAAKEPTSDAAALEETTPEPTTPEESTSETTTSETTPDTPKPKCFPTKASGKFFGLPTSKDPLFAGIGSPDGNYFITSGHGKNAQLYKAPGQTFIAQLSGSTSSAGLAFSFDNKQLTSTVGDILYLFDFPNTRRHAISPRKCCFAAAFSPDGKYIAFSMRSDKGGPIPRVHIYERSKPNSLGTPLLAAPFTDPTVQQTLIAFRKEAPQSKTQKLYVSTQSPRFKQIVAVYDVKQPSKPPVVLPEKGRGKPFSNGKWLALMRRDSNGVPYVALYDMQAEKVQFTLKDPGATKDNTIYESGMNHSMTFYAYATTSPKLQDKHNLVYWDMRTLKPGIDNTPTGTFQVPRPQRPDNGYLVAQQSFHFSPDDRTLWIPLGGGVPGRTRTGEVAVYTCP